MGPQMWWIAVDPLERLVLAVYCERGAHAVFGSATEHCMPAFNISVSLFRLPKDTLCTIKGNESQRANCCPCTTCLRPRVHRQKELPTSWHLSLYRPIAVKRDYRHRHKKYHSTRDRCFAYMSSMMFRTNQIRLASTSTPLLPACCSIHNFR